MNDIKKAFEDSLDMDTSDMYMQIPHETKSLTEIHLEMDKILNEGMKNNIWLMNESVERRMKKTLESMGYKDVKFKIKPKAIYPQLHWLFYCEPEWYWTSEHPYRDALSLYLLGESGKKGAEAGKKLRMILIDEAKDPPEDMEKYWTKTWEEIIEEEKE